MNEVVEQFGRITLKRIILLSATTLACLSLAACGNQSSRSRSKVTSSSTSSKVVKHNHVKHHKQQKDTTNKKNDAESSSSSSATNSSSAAGSSQQQQSSQSQSNKTSNSQNSDSNVNNADDAVAAAKAKYGDDNGRIHWGYMIDGNTGQPMRNADGSYFVKGTADNGTMTGTEYSVNVYSDGSMTNN